MTRERAHTFCVWAPRAEQVDLAVNDPSGDGPKFTRAPMHCEGEGWWSVEVPGAGPGTDYGFFLDGEGPYPDPCSPWQPNGVHGLSRLVDHSAFPWTDWTFQARPLPSGVIYELHVGTFTDNGTFDAAILKLDELVELGITHIELMPVAEFPGRRGWGYDGVDLYAPHHAYGGPQGLKRLVDACHARGLGVLLDVVYNHLGPDGSYLDRFGPYHSELHNTAWGQAMNFDGPGSDGVRKFFLDNARMWLADYHLDGLRLDAVHAIIDNSATHFLEELSEMVDRLEIELGRHLVLIAESDLNDPRLVQPCALGGYGLDAQWSDDFHHALHVLLTGEQAGYYAGFQAWDDLRQALENVFVFNGRYSTLRGRRHGRPAVDLPGYRFIGYLQNHDQVGNRAAGDRIHQQASPELAMVGAAIVLTSPFIPLLFQGEEWGATTPFQYFTDHQNEELGRAVSEGRRSEFGGEGWLPEQVPDPQVEETFQRSCLKWVERFEPPHTRLLDWHRRLIALRRGQKDLLDGRMANVQVDFDREAGWVAIHRGAVCVSCSLVDRETRVPLDISSAAEILLASNERAALADGEAILPPYGVIILQDRER
jgi:maltooligosyltrehalose trehalohydrolase